MYPTLNVTQWLQSTGLFKILAEIKGFITNLKAKIFL